LAVGASGDTAAALALTQDIAALERFDATLTAITADDFHKLHKLCAVLRERWRWSPRRTRDRLVIFTERKATQALLFDALQQRLGLKPAQIAARFGEAMP